jgi:hypothetical protein
VGGVGGQYTKDGEGMYHTHRLETGRCG